jgi:16S rRNA processing protein RimM
LWTERFVSALLGAPVGVKGFIKLRSLSGEEAHLVKAVFLTLRLPNGAERRLEVEAFANEKQALSLKFRGFDSPEAVRALSGAEVLVERVEAASLKPGEYYVEDLKGLTVTAPDGSGLGEVSDIIEAGNGQLLELRLPDGSLKLVPFRDEFIGDITVEGGQIELIAPWVL